MNELIHGPKDEEWFRVVPAEINRSLFIEQRKDEKQEKVRLLINEAFETFDKKPEFYKKAFKTLRPTKIWSKATEINLIERAHWTGDYLGTWMDQALEWAQRIQNGETWEALCNEYDNLKWYRLIMWRDGEVRIIGGSTQNNDYCSPTTITGHEDLTMQEKLVKYTVPLVIVY